MTSINWDDLASRAEEAEKPVSEGKHLFRVTSATATETKDGTPKLSLLLHVIGDDPQVGKSVFGTIVLGGKDPQIRFMFRHLGAFGITSKFLRDNKPSPEQLAQMLEGRQIGAEIKHTTWEKELQATIKNYVPVEDAEPVEMPSAKDSTSADDDYAF